MLFIGLFMKELHSIWQLDNRQLSQKIKYALFENIKENIHGNELLKLPKEEVLAQQLGVSRNGLWDVLTVLEEDGYISRFVLPPILILWNGAVMIPLPVS